MSDKLTCRSRDAPPVLRSTHQHGRVVLLQRGGTFLVVHLLEHCGIHAWRGIAGTTSQRPERRLAAPSPRQHKPTFGSAPKCSHIASHSSRDMPATPSVIEWNTEACRVNQCAEITAINNVRRVAELEQGLDLKRGASTCQARRASSKLSTPSPSLSAYSQHALAFLLCHSVMCSDTARLCSASAAANSD